MMVGLSLMKSSSCRTSVSEPNTSTMTAVTSGMTGKCRGSAYDTASASTTATMNTAVATKIPVCSPEAMSAGSMGETSGRNSAGRELARKNSSNGPRSSTSLRRGLSSAFFAVMGAVCSLPDRQLPCRPGLHRHRPSAEDTISFNPRDRPREILRRERCKVVDTFAHADEMHRQAVFRRNGNQDAAARGAVELGHDKPGDAGDVAKDLDLGERILPDRCVEHQQNGMRHCGVDLLHHAHDLLQLVHQHRLVLRAAGGVDEQHVYFLAPRLRERVENEPGGVGTRSARDHQRAAAPTPDVELVDGGRAEGIAGGEHHRAALGAELGGELADGRSLARAVDADDEGDERPSCADQERLGHRDEDLLDFGGNDRFHL